MRLITSVILAIFLLMNTSINAATGDATLNFFIGKVTVLKNGRNPVTPAGNMSLGMNDIIKTGKSSQAEITVKGASCFVGENKTIRIGELTARETSNPLMNAMKKISKSSEKSRVTTIAAVRADKMDDEISWADEKTSSKASGKTDKNSNDDAVLNKLSAMMADDNYSDAWSFYSGARVSAKNKNRLDFMGGLAGYNLCMYNEAGRVFTGLSKSSDDPQIRIESTFYAGLSLSSALNYREAISSFTAYITAQPEGNHTAQAYFLRGVCYLNTGQKEKAKQDLKHVTSMSAADQLAGDAENILAEIK